MSEKREYFKKEHNLSFFIYIPIHVSIPSPLPIPTLTTPPAFIQSSERVRHIAQRKEQAPPHYIRADQGIHPKKMVSKTSAPAAGINPGVTASGPAVCPSHKLSPTFRGSSLVLCWFLPCLARVGELTSAQVSCFSGCPHHGLDLFAHILTPPTLQLKKINK